MMKMQEPTLIPNSQGGEFCPDWPRTCICPIEPKHDHLPVHQIPCGHCTDGQVQVPMEKKPEGIPEPSTRDLMFKLALDGARYCERCRNVLCDNCGNRDVHRMNYDCASKDAKPRNENTTLG